MNQQNARPNPRHRPNPVINRNPKRLFQEKKRIPKQRHH